MTEKKEERGKGGNWLKHKVGNAQIKLVTRNKTKRDQAQKARKPMSDGKNL